MRRAGPCLLLAALGALAPASGPAAPRHPLPRPVTPAVPGLVPLPRPAAIPAPPPADATRLGRAALPEPRPAKPLRRTGASAAPQRRIGTIGARGALCGDSGIRGVRLRTIPGRLKACGIDTPVRVRRVAGVTLSRPAIVDCRTATTLARWVREGLKPVIGRLGGGPRALRVAAHYACRTRNNQPGAKISEHAHGHAVDISAVRLRNGAVLSVKRGWHDPAQRALLRRLHRAACGIFGTVLGPNADRHHRDHFHFDTARYRGGAYCR